MQAGEWLHSNFSRNKIYLVPLAAIGSALCLKLLIAPLLVEQSPFLIFFTAILVSAWYGGLQAGIFATILAALASDFFFIEPVGQLEITRPDVALRFGIFMIEGLVVSGLSYALHQSHRRALQEMEQRSRSETALRESEFRLRAILEQAPVMLWTMDTNLKINSATGAALQDLKFTPEIVIGRGIEDFQLEIGSEDTVRSHQAALAGHSGQHDVKLQGLSYHICVQPLRNEAHQIIGVIGIGFDISDRKLAEAKQVELALERERFNLLEEFVGEISHDFKTPLTVINTNVYLLERSARTDQEHTLLQTIKSQVARMNQYVQDILSLCRMEREPTAPKEPVQINDVLRTTHESLSARAATKHLEIKTEFSNDVPIMKGDINLLYRAFMNILSNAVNYTENGGQITLRTRIEDHETVVEVQDNGIGIAKESLPFIFDRYYRGQEGKEVNTSGSGLGLTITRKIIGAHGGHIEVESEINHGSLFRISFPIAEPG